MPHSDTSICNLALGLIGVGRISDINGTTAIERDCKAIFEHARRDVLGSYHWGFARKQALLAQNATAPIIDSDHGGYDYAYDLPSDCISPMRLSDPQTEFERVGDTLQCNLDSEVYLHYTADVTNAAKFSEKFVTNLSHRLAAPLAFTIKKDKKLSQEMWDMYYALTPMQQAEDAGGDNKPTLVKNPYVEARGGS